MVFLDKIEQFPVFHGQNSQDKIVNKSKQQWRTQRVVAELQDGHLREPLLSLLEAHVESGSYFLFFFFLSHFLSTRFGIVFFFLVLY